MFNMCEQVQRLGGRKLLSIALQSQVVWLVYLLVKQKVVGLVLDRDTSSLWGCVRKRICIKLKHMELIAVATPLVQESS